MSKTLLVGYGGFGCTCVSNYVAGNEVPALFLDVHPPAEGLDIRGDFMELGSDLRLDGSRLRNALDGYQNIILVSSLGGQSFADAYRVLAESAESLGIGTISVCTIPYVFETDHRERAMENLGILSGSVRNMFVLDSQKTLADNGPTSKCVERTCDYLLNVLDILLPLLEYSPFRSYCSESVYTYAITESPVPVDAVKDGLAHPNFDVQKMTGKILVCTGHELGDMEREQVEAAVTSVTGVLPEIISGMEYGKDRYLLIIPISCRNE